MLYNESIIGQSGYLSPKNECNFTHNLYIPIVNFIEHMTAEMAILIYFIKYMNKLAATLKGAARSDDVLKRMLISMSALITLFCVWPIALSLINIASKDFMTLLTIMNNFHFTFLLVITGFPQRGLKRCILVGSSQAQRSSRLQWVMRHEVP
jgi:hypothetical protein